MADLTSEAIEKIQEMAEKANSKDRLVQINDQTYTFDNYGEPKLVIPQNQSKNRVSVSTLSGIVGMIKNMDERKDSKLFIQVLSPTKVQVFGALDVFGRREGLINAEAMIPSFDFDEYYDAESLNIALQARFVQTPDRDVILKVIGNLKEQTVHSSEDDGVSQSVQIKSGVASVAEVKVPNPVSLRPYRTFIEVPQPSSNFIFRMREGMEAALFEADGGAWKNEAMRGIKEFLAYNLDDEIKSNHVTVIA